MVYADNAATTKMSRTAIDAMLPYMETHYGNPSSLYRLGQEAAEALQSARETVAACLGCTPREITFTSGGSEADNQALISAARIGERKGKKHIISTAFEHHAILHTLKKLEKEGFQVELLPVHENGMVSARQVADAIREDTCLVTVMYANNEIGSILPIAEIGAVCREKGVLFHTDAVQAAGHLHINVKEQNIDMLSLSGHKFHGPKGIGALYVRRKPRVRIECQIHGGGHERGMRSGTLATHQIVGMGEAYRLAKEEMETEMPRLARLRDRLWDGIRNNIPEVYLNGSMEHRSPHNLNVSFAFIEGESLMMAMKDIAVSSGSACTSASLEPSYVLRALGRDDELAHSSIRFTLGRFTTEEEIDYVIKTLVEGVTRLREMSPLWEMHQQGVDLNQVQWSEH